MTAVAEINVCNSKGSPKSKKNSGTWVTRRVCVSPWCGQYHHSLELSIVWRRLVVSNWQRKRGKDSNHKYFPKTWPVPLFGLYWRNPSLIVLHPLFDLECAAICCVVD